MAATTASYSVVGFSMSQAEEAQYLVLHMESSTIISFIIWPGGSVPVSQVLQ
jgi:hypothetical protein